MCVRRLKEVTKKEKIRKWFNLFLLCLTEDAPWYMTTSSRIYLIVSTAGAALLVIILSMLVALCRRARQIKTKGSM